ncbi:MAG: hypothetical protein ABI540_01935 [Spartobacteria bacterium]
MTAAGIALITSIANSAASPWPASRCPFRPFSSSSYRTARQISLTKSALTLAALLTLPMSPLLAQELPKSDDSFEVEPPLLIPPGDVEGDAEESPDAQPDAGKLEQQLERAKKSAASAERLVKRGILAKVEAEQRALRVARLEAELANAQMVAAKEQVASQQARSAAGQASKAELDAAMTTQAQATVAAQTAEENYHKAQIEAAELNVRRQRRLLAQGSARKSDVARAEEKLATLQQGEHKSP